MPTRQHERLGDTVDGGDRFQLLNFSLGLWNTRDPFLKDGPSV